MSSVKDAYQALLAVAAIGRPYRFDQVYAGYSVSPEEEAGVIGTGCDFTLTTPVLDRDTSANATVDGTAELRVLRLTNKGNLRLLVRIRLTWTTSAGDTHVSFAVYEITPEAAARLAVMPEVEESGIDYGALPADERDAAAFRALMEAGDEAEHYNAIWLQTYPGEEVEYLGPDEATGEYHSAAIEAAKQAAPELLCMLSDMDMGSVEPREISLINAWVQRQPKTSISSV